MPHPRAYPGRSQTWTGTTCRLTTPAAEQALATAEAIAAFVKERLSRGAAGHVRSGPAPGPRTCGPGEVREARAARPWSTDSGVIRSFVSTLAASLPVKTLVLFGSRARGDHSPDSDYDFVLVSDCFTGLNPAERRDRPYRAWLAAKSDWSADIFCLTPAELVAMSNPLLWDALEEGIPIADDGIWAKAAVEFRGLRAAGRLVAVEDGWLFAPPPSPAGGIPGSKPTPPCPPGGGTGARWVQSQT